MANILSQAEVDSLLGGLGPDEVEDEIEVDPSQSAGSKVASYDFRRPNRVSKEQLRFIQTIHEGFSRSYASALSGYLRSMVDIEVTSVDQLTYGEYVLSLPSTTSLYIFGMAPLEGLGVFEVNPTLILAMIDRLFGGPGGHADLARDLTSIETAVMTKLIQRALFGLSEAWEHIVPIKPALDRLEKNPQMMQLLPNSETVILISLELKMQRSSGFLSLCYPFMTMEPIIPSIGRQALARSRRPVPEGPSWITQRIAPSEVPVSAELGSTELTVAEFLELRRGDVIRLDRRVNELVDVRVGGVEKAKAHAGIQGRNRVVRLETVGDSDQEGAKQHVA